MDDSESVVIWFAFKKKTNKQTIGWIEMGRTTAQGDLSGMV